MFDLCNRLRYTAYTIANLPLAYGMTQFVQALAGGGKHGYNHSVFVTDDFNFTMITLLLILIQ